jgi:hypothetical protein
MYLHLPENDLSNNGIPFAQTERLDALDLLPSKLNICTISASVYLATPTIAGRMILS